MEVRLEVPHASDQVISDFEVTIDHPAFRVVGELEQVEMTRDEYLFWVAFEPVEEGLHSGTVTVRSARACEAECPEAQEVTSVVRAQVVRTELDYWPKALSFGEVAAGEDAERTVELEAQLRLGDGLWAELVASPGVEVFGDGDSSGVVLESGDSKRVSVRYTAESAAAWTGELEVHTGGEVFVVPLSANEEVPVDDTDADGDGFTVFDGDCDDNSGVIHPLSIEVEDYIDNDCDGRVDEGFFDADRDGYAAPKDCNDTSEWSSPEGVEVADGLDNDCDGSTDEGFDGEPLEWFECPEPEQAIAPIDCSCDHGPGSPPLAAAWVAWLLLRRRSEMD